MSDVLNDLNVVVPPAYSCGEFEVSGAVILECQDFVECGCPGVAPYELAPFYFASLADHHALLELRSAILRHLEEDAAACPEDAPPAAEEPH